VEFPDAEGGERLECWHSYNPIGRLGDHSRDGRDRVGDGIVTAMAPVTAHLAMATLVAIVDSFTNAPSHSSQGPALAKNYDQAYCRRQSL
jgi:hypothetical protein